jgi:hypothetical protein
MALSQRRSPRLVIPAKAGIQRLQGFAIVAKSLDDQPTGCYEALPAFAGMTSLNSVPFRSDIL